MTEYKLVKDMKLWGETGEVPDRQSIEDTYPELDRFGHKRLWQTGKLTDVNALRDLLDNNRDVWLEQARQRDYVIKQYGFAIPCKEAIEELCKYQPLIEVGAGSGYWTWLLNRCDINCIASDNCSGFNNILTHASYDCEFKKLDGAEAVTQYPSHNVLMVWPSYHEPWSEAVLKAMQPGQVLLSVTEGAHGCCATKKFFNLLSMGFEELNYVRLPQWDGIHDGLYVHKRLDNWKRTKAVRSW